MSHYGLLVNCQSADRKVARPARLRSLRSFGAAQPHTRHT